MWLQDFVPDIQNAEVSCKRVKRYAQDEEQKWQQERSYTIEQRPSQDSRQTTLHAQDARHTDGQLPDARQAEGQPQDTRQADREYEEHRLHQKLDNEPGMQQDIPQWIPDRVIEQGSGRVVKLCHLCGSSGHFRKQCPKSTQDAGGRAGRENGKWVRSDGGGGGDGAHAGAGGISGGGAYTTGRVAFLSLGEALLPFTREQLGMRGDGEAGVPFCVRGSGRHSTRTCPQASAGGKSEHAAGDRQGTQGGSRGGGSGDGEDGGDGGRGVRKQTDCYSLYDPVSLDEAGPGISTLEDSLASRITSASVWGLLRQIAGG